MFQLDDLVLRAYLSTEPICAEGREFLAARGLSIPVAHQKGFCSFGGNLYFIYSIGNKVVRWKRRSMTNKKDQKWGDWLINVADDAKIPFYSQFKRPTSDDLIITEGEFDCIAIAQLGAFNCVSLPNGAGSVEKTFKGYYEFLQEFETIYIAFDMDEPGQEAAKKAMALLPPHKYRRINFPYKDANEWVKECDPSEDDFKSLMVNAEKITSRYFTHGSDIPKDVFKKIDIGVSTGWPNLNGLLGGIRLKELTVISADTGSGKSTFCLNLCKNLLEKKCGVWINSYEMSHEIVIRKILGLLTNKCYKVNEVPPEDIDRYYKWCEQRDLYFNLISDVVSLAKIRQHVELAALAYNTPYILLDHLDYIVAGGTKATHLENIDATLRELHSLALEYNVAILLVAHPKQLPSNHEITISDIKGSSAIKQYADNILLLTRMDRNDPTSVNRFKVHVGKNRLLGKEGHVYLSYDPQCDGFKEISFQINHDEG